MSLTHTQIALCGAVAVLLAARRVALGLGHLSLGPTRTLFSRDGGGVGDQQRFARGELPPWRPEDRPEAGP